MIMHHVYYIVVLWIGCTGKVKELSVLEPIGSDHARLDNMNCNYMYTSNFPGEKNSPSSPTDIATSDGQTLCFLPSIRIYRSEHE